jgi:hypothetical protein
MNCRVVYDVTLAGYAAWPFPVIGGGISLLAFIVAIIRSRVSPSSSRIIWLLPVATAVFALGTFGATYLSHLKTVRVLKSGRYQSIEGRIEEFKPMPFQGHSLESFVVHGQRFEYSDYALTPGFHQTRSHGGPFDAGVYVKIKHTGNTILYAEICD